MDFHGLARRQLQALCKQNKIPANLTNVAMADALAALEHVEGVEEILQPEMTENGSPEAQRTVTRTSTRPKKPVVKVQESAGIVPRSRARTVRKLDDESIEDEELFAVNTPAVASSRRRAPVAASLKKAEESSVQKVYSTRRSVRLVEKQLSELCLGEGPKRTQPAIKIDDELSREVTENDVKEEDVKEVIYEKNAEAEIQKDGGVAEADIAGAGALEGRMVSIEESDLGATEEVVKHKSVGEALKDDVFSSQASDVAVNTDSVAQEGEFDALLNIAVNEEISVSEKDLVTEAVMVEAISSQVSTGTEEVAEDIAANFRSLATDGVMKSEPERDIIGSVVPENLKLGDATNDYGSAELGDAEGKGAANLSITEHMLQVKAPAPVLAQGELYTVFEFGRDSHDADSMICQIDSTDGDVALDDGSVGYESEDSAKLATFESMDEAKENSVKEVAVSVAMPSLEEPVFEVAEESVEKGPSSEVVAVHPMTGNNREPLAEKITSQEANTVNKANAVNPLNSKTPLVKMSLRRLEKMLREKLTISNPKDKDEEDNATNKEAVIKQQQHHSVQPRQALKTLPVNMNRMI